ncbi:MAG TPA: hypothetical protein PK440_00670 [Candidatus Accumulibacter phosphatis]|nr:MAG: hypothetical protein AW07_00469 [Candidatus Accumulibacter sp. SK-11]HAY28977.1 hypothetical protein [Accumulibacter sp.]HCN67271.1 hypothetical protein [Accumulibacter sp.]HRL74226.1 hypothetical protein [Candidatus Accumulibacter phosphatis]HRQ93515.1 hypothetical protein [Candidatus Accumulibacter phosphatis]
MSNPREIMQVSLPVPEAADLATRAAAANMPLAEYLGFHVLSSAYGLLHPDVRAFMRRAMSGVYGPVAEPVQAVGEPGAPGYGGRSPGTGGIDHLKERRSDGEH